MFYMFHDNDLPVFKEIPDTGILIDIMGHISDWKKVRANESLLKPENQYYHCRKCEGYIQGKPVSQGEDTIRPLSGRRGTSYCCKRCGQEMLFNGCMS